jgi:kumamolisin
MAKPSKVVPVPGSERAPLPGARAVGPVAANERFEVTLRVRPRSPIPSAAALGGQAPTKRQYLSREEYAAAHGASAEDIAKVEQFAQSHGLAVVEASNARRSVVLSGTAAAFSAAFNVKLEHYAHADGTYRGRTGPVHIPAELAGVVEGVFGLDNRPQASPRLQKSRLPKALKPLAEDGTFTPTQLAQLYNFPTGLDGSGQCIALIELGGGFRPADIKAYFTKLGLPTPSVTAVSVDGGKNHPTTADSDDGEVMLDIEVAGAVAPQARVVVYFAPNTDQGFLDAITTAIQDQDNKPSVISISWGAPEASWTAQAMQQMDHAFQAAAAVGVTVCVAAGDRGSGDGMDGANVDFPSSSPFVLGCGGTRLVASGNTITSETVWNDDPKTSATGGGVSSFFPLPDYQSASGVPPSANPGGGTGRGVPDVAGDADPVTGYQVRVDGQDFVIGGTSAVAPLWAGLIALLNQSLGTPVGFLNPLLYTTLAAQGVCRDITEGNNGAYSAGPGWDACTGLGSPNGATLLAALGGGGTPHGSGPAATPRNAKEINLRIDPAAARPSIAGLTSFFSRITPDPNPGRTILTISGLPTGTRAISVWMTEWILGDMPHAGGAFFYTSSVQLYNDGTQCRVVFDLDWSDHLPAACQVIYGPG